jgi:hypothetical protein
MRLRTGTASAWIFVTTSLAVIAVCTIVGLADATSGQVHPLSVPIGDAVPELVDSPASLLKKAVNSIAVAEEVYQGGDRQVGPGDPLTPTIWLPLVARCYPPICWCSQNDQNLAGKTVFALADCSDGTLFAGAEDGIYRRGPGDIEWKQEVSTIGEVRGLAASSDCTAVYAAVLDQGVLSRDGGSWPLVSTSEITGARTVVLACGKILAGGDFGVWCSPVGSGHPWKPCAVPFEYKSVISLVRSDGWIYAAVWCGGVWRCPECNCHQWEPMGLNKRCVLYAIGSPTDGAPKFAGLNEAFYRWNGTDWESPQPWGNARTFCFAIDGTTAYAGRQGSGVLRSTDGGLTWDPVNDGWGPPSQVRALLIHVDGGGQRWLYAGTTEGVWRYLLPSSDC